VKTYTHACMHMKESLSIHQTKRVLQLKVEKKTKTHFITHTHFPEVSGFIKLWNTHTHTHTHTHEWMCLNCHPMCTFPNLFILSPTRCYLYNFLKHQRLHLPEHPTTAARRMDMIKETLCTYSVRFAQWECFNPKFYIEISHYVGEPSSKTFYQHGHRMQITLKRGVSRHTNLSQLNGPATLMPATLCSRGLQAAVAIKVQTAAVWTDLSRLNLNTRSFRDLTGDTIPVIDGLTRHYLRKLSCTH